MGDCQSGESWRHKNVLNPIPASQERAASLPNHKLIAKYNMYICMFKLPLMFCKVFLTLG